MHIKTILTIALAIVGSVAFADKIHLKSGSTLSGKVGKIVDDKIAFESDDLGKIKVDIEKVMKIEVEGKEEHVVQYKDAREETLPLTIEGGEITLEGKPFDKAQVKKIDPEEETWHGSVNLAFNAARGNTYDNSWSVVANVNRKWDKDRVKGDFGYHYTETGTTGASDKQKTTDRWTLEGQHDHFWAAKFYTFENGKYERDRIQFLDYRVRLGLGIGYQWLDDEVVERVGKWNFNQEAGANWVAEGWDTKEDKDENFAAFRYAHHLKFNPAINEDLEFFHNLEYLPEVDDFEKYLINCDVGFTTKLIYNWDLLAKIEWEYNSKPAADRKKSDYRYLVGLGYKW